MARTSGRSYLTYRQIVVCAFVDLEREENGGVGRAFHKNSLHAKIRHLARAENFNLGEYWTRRVAKAVNKLLDEGVLRKATRNAFIGLSPKGRKRLVTSHERYGPLEKLSPFKKSQFLKNIATTSVIKTPRSCAVSESNLENANILKKYNSQQEEIKSLRAVLRDTQRELEDTKMDRDDLELELREYEPRTYLKICSYRNFNPPPLTHRAYCTFRLQFFSGVVLDTPNTNTWIASTNPSDA
ncbi:hypothetical protein K439DRAFT_261223 [Ramaria rubella]|nr:hypothetical protein K439DRAFT_261223 [Ramaria rubella]